MNKLSIAEKLNQTIYDNFTADSGFKTEFRCGNYIDEIIKILSEVCPYSKVATLYFNGTYVKHGKTFSEALKHAGFKPVSVILPEDFSDDVNYFKKLFVLPDDVRAVITFDTNLMRAVKYFASVKDIAGIFVLQDFLDTSFISPKITLVNNGVAESVSCKASQYIVLDDNLYKTEPHLIFSVVASYCVALLDYKIYCKVHSKRYIKSANDLMQFAVNSALSVFKNSAEDQPDILIYSLFTTELANILSGGDMLSVSSVNSVGRILKRFSGYNRIIFIKYALALYEKAFGGEYDNLLEIPDYNLRAESLSKITGIGEESFMKNFMSQIPKIKDAGKKILQFKPTLLDEINKTQKLFGQINSTYHALGGGGKEDKNLRTALFYSGDVTPYVNGMSLVRESGILEFLQV